MTLFATKPLHVSSPPLLPSAADPVMDPDADPLLLALSQLNDPLPESLAVLFYGVTPQDVERWDAACLKERLVWAVSRRSTAAKSLPHKDEAKSTREHETTLKKLDPSVQTDPVNEVRRQSVKIVNNNANAAPSALARAESCVRNLERELERVQQHHADVVQGLWKEVARVQEECSSLTYKLVMQSSNSLPSSSVSSSTTEPDTLQSHTTPPRSTASPPSSSAVHSPISTFIAARPFPPPGTPSTSRVIDGPQHPIRGPASAQRRVSSSSERRLGDHQVIPGSASKQGRPATPRAAISETSRPVTPARLEPLSSHGDNTTATGVHLPPIPTSSGLVTSSRTPARPALAPGSTSSSAATLTEIPPTTLSTTLKSNRRSLGPPKSLPALGLSKSLRAPKGSMKAATAGPGDGTLERLPSEAEWNAGSDGEGVGDKYTSPQRKGRNGAGWKGWFGTD
ncbi:hypothetical protein M427DRAFT_55367 [Gonapodya prolifera JEL478]|uniref:CCDC92/74 N-terminal domain-containing protein n=1 Tax=Gonapodya prolifera (strain JEL478) TaxID=1344416 RepID=A0A139AIK4_GONPJ|nr:hypothetical protein M427DRAFT_55367 [Gonapodya prolifera JEL478]|eukprot:KXS16384.1 hypothetical protein M427DRAFT_55367 [Gonapodya prolifera JEL478]